MNRRAFLASLLAVGSAPVVEAFAPAGPAPIVLGPAMSVAFTLPMPPPIDIEEYRLRYIMPAVDALANATDDDIMARFP